VVKQASGVLIQPLVRQASERMSRRLQVYQTVLDAIHRHVLAPGARLPSARQLAADWGVARGAVDEAFAQLQIEGYLERFSRTRRECCVRPANRRSRCSIAFRSIWASPSSSNYRTCC
jgi:DNA-binding transcriptional MocR family regulator